MLPEEKARVKIDKQLNNAGWDIVDRKDYLPNYAMAVKEALMQGGKESDYLLFVDNKAIGVVEAKKESDSLGPKVASQAEHYAKTPQNWYGLWFQGLIPLVYLANGNKIYFKNILLGEDAAPFLDKKAQKAYMIKGKSWVNNHAHILQSLVFPEYLTNCLNSIDYFDYVYGTTRLKLTQENMNRILVPVPSIEEQCKIAQAINNLFVLIESIKASLS